MFRLFSRIKPGLAVIAAGCYLLAGNAYAEDLNPKFFYFYNGQTPGNWTLQIADPGGWGINVVDKTGKSNNAKIKVSPENYNAEGDAIRAVWSRKKMRGEIKVAGSAIDISEYKDQAALTFDLKINAKPKKDVLVGIDCHYPCRAEVSISKQLRKRSNGEWFIFPIPLNCFKSDDFDLSKVNAFMISTEGKLNLSIANVRLERLPEGEAGCSD